MTMQAAGTPTLLAPVGALTVAGESLNVAPDSEPGTFFAILAGLGGPCGGASALVAAPAYDGQVSVLGGNAVPGGEASEAAVKPAYGAVDAAVARVTALASSRPAATSVLLTGRPAVAIAPTPAASLDAILSVEGRGTPLANNSPVAPVVGAPVDAAHLANAPTVVGAHTITSPPISAPGGGAVAKQSTKDSLADAMTTAGRDLDAGQSNPEPVEDNGCLVRQDQPTAADCGENWSALAPAAPADVLVRRDAGASAMDPGEPAAASQLRNSSAPPSQLRGQRDHARSGVPAPGTESDRESPNLQAPVVPTVTSEAAQLAGAELAAAPGTGAGPPQPKLPDAASLLAGATPIRVAHATEAVPATGAVDEELGDMSRTKPSPDPLSRSRSIARNPTLPAAATAPEPTQADRQAVGADGPKAAGSVASPAARAPEQAPCDWSSPDDTAASSAGRVETSSSLRPQAQVLARSAAAATGGVARPSSSFAAPLVATAPDRAEKVEPAIAGQRAPGAATEPAGAGASSTERPRAIDDTARMISARRSGALAGFDEMASASRATTAPETVSDTPLNTAVGLIPVHGPAGSSSDLALAGGQSGAASLPLASGLLASPQSTVDLGRGSATALHDAAPAAQTVPVLLSLASRGGSAALSLQLKPNELGHLHVRITRDEMGAAAVSVTVERADTLALLVRDQVTLHRALDQAGVASPSRSITFHLASVTAQPTAQAPGGPAQPSGGGQQGDRPQYSAGADAGGSNGSGQQRREAFRGQGAAAQVSADAPPRPGRTSMMTGAVNITA